METTSKVAEGQPTAWPLDERAPLIHMMEERSNEERRHLSHAMTRLYD